MWGGIVRGSKIGEGRREVVVSSVGMGRTIGSGGRGEREWRAKEYGEERECVWSGQIKRGGDQILVVVKGCDVAPVARGNINGIWGRE